MHPEAARPRAALVALLLLTGCATGFSPPESAVTGASAGDGAVPESPRSTTAPVEESPPDDLWARVREGFALAPAGNRPAVRQWVQFYASHKRHLLSSAERARPFLWHIVEAIEARGMPLEIAMLPIVESGYDPSAHSYASAAGLWQFIPITARRFGLDRNWWYDERRDVLSSTNAALDYLSWLHARFDDWLLALAAYNAGERRVDRAIARNRRAGQPTDFWHLDLPAETENYVPKLLALRRILLDPAQYALDWPALPNAPLTATVALPSQVELSRAADMIDLPTQALRAINPGFRRWATHPEDAHSLLVPIDQAKNLRTALRKADPDSLVTWGRHRVRRGQVLSRIAERYGTSVSMLQRVNNLGSTLIHPGDSLLIPTAARPADAPVVAGSAPARRHEVRRGENLWVIARRYGVRVAALRRWNDLKRGAVLHPGQSLVVRAEDGRAPTVEYQVRSGDSLWSIANDFGVEIAALRRWNNLRSGAVLQPGMRLAIRSPGTERIVYYRVRQGDSLWSIASRFSVEVVQLRDWNQLADATIRPGQKLRILVDATS